MKKIALVVQRYGLEVNGGAEYHCRIVAEKLSSLFDVEILTSCAKDHFTWANEYPEGETEINGIKIRRFSVPQERNKSKVHRLLKKMNNQSFLQQIYRLFGIIVKILPGSKMSAIGREWSKQQGPYMPGLITHLKNHQQDYDVLIFFTYLYFPTFCGLRIAPHKSILIPTAHDEPAIHLPIFKSFFKLPKVILYNTLSEKKLVNRLFHNSDIYSDIVGAGIDAVQSLKLHAPKLLQSDEPYLIYIGRIDPGKGCDVMFDHFLKYKDITGSSVKLVLVGKSFMKVPEHPDVINMGFVEEHVKHALLQGAKALVMPSRYESLSLVTLESMQEGVPVIANDDCEVLKDHIQESRAGFTFSDFESFKTAADKVLDSDAAEFTILRENAREYVRENYNWELILSKFVRAIDFASK